MDPQIPGFVAVAVGLGGVLAIVVCIVRNRSFTKEVQVHRASRWSSGNRIWPTQVAVLPTSVVRYRPKLFGHSEETISIDQVASISVNAGFFLADVVIETTGGSRPIVCHGHWTKAANSIRDAIAAAKEQRISEASS